MRRAGDAARLVSRLGVGAVGVLALAACQVNLATTVNVAENGSGAITVVASADAAALRAAPELADSLNTDDLTTAGWGVNVQNPSAEGGLSVTLRRSFSTVDEATMFLAQLSGENGPLRELSLVRFGGANDSTYEFVGKAGLPQGLSGFADAEALAAIGGAPFTDSLAAQGGSLADKLSMSLTITMPGEPLSTNGATTPRADDDLTTTFSWSVPADQSEVSLAASTRNRDVAAIVTGYLAWMLLVAMILFVAAAVIYVATVVFRRSQATPDS
jgi:hypothetical protein